MGLISSAALLIPILVIIGLRLGAYRSFPALLIYYILVFGFNILSEGYIKVDNTIVHYYGLINNLLEAPLIIYFLTYFSPSAGFTRNMKKISLFFIAFEIILILIFGFNVNTVSIIMGPGLLIIISFCIHFFIRQTKITIMHHKATGKAIMTSALLFAYGCYSIIYLMYYVFKTHIENGQVKQKEVEDTFLIYFVVTTFSALLICAGIIIERRRIQKLTELKHTRKELSIVYRDTFTTKTPVKSIALDFDREEWN